MVQPDLPVITTEQFIPRSSTVLRNDAVASNTNGERRDSEARDKTRLKRVLPAWQILMIAIGGVIGVTIFSTSGEIIHTAGPAGLLVATCFVSITTICVMECIAEMVVLWPVSNAIIEFVKVFVDRDLAIVIGIAYWYTMSSVFALLIVAASDFASFWLTDQTWRIILFYAIIPFCLLIINCVGVSLYGWIEGIGGIVKLGLVAVGIVFMIVDAPRVGNKNIDTGFHHNADEVKSNFVAVCVCIPLLAYGFIGTEIVSVTAFEAKDRKSLRFPVRWVAYIICSLYLASAILEMVVIGYNNCDLPDLNSNWTAEACPDRYKASRSTGGNVMLKRSTTGPPWNSIVVLAALDYGSKPLGWLFNASVIYFCLSAANTALYVASRTLFGLTRGINRMSSPPRYLKPLRYFGMTSPRMQVPHFALIFSAVAFFWLPYLRSRRNYSAPEVIVVMSTTGSIGGVTVWLSQCIAYIRYYHWFHNLKRLGMLPGEYNRWDPQPKTYDWHKHRTLMASLRTLPAWIGLVGCFLIVFVFSSATFWNGNITFTKVATAYAGPVILFVILIILKLWKRRLWVRLPLTPQALFEVTNYLEQNSGIPLVPLAPVEMVPFGV